MAGCAVPGLAAGRLRRNHRAGERPGTLVLVFRSTYPGKLNIEIVELRWGQGAKDIGGEVKIKDLARAQMLKSGGYVVLEPTDPEIIEAFKRGVFSEFERHSRVGMVSEDGFMDRVQELKAAGTKHVFLKTGAYRPADLTRAIKFASKAKIDSPPWTQPVAAQA